MDGGYTQFWTWLAGWLACCCVLVLWVCVCASCSLKRCFGNECKHSVRRRWSGNAISRHTHTHSSTRRERHTGKRVEANTHTQRTGRRPSVFTPADSVCVSWHAKRIACSLQLDSFALRRPRLNPTHSLAHSLKHIQPTHCIHHSTAHRSHSTQNAETVSQSRCSQPGGQIITGL